MKLRESRQGQIHVVHLVGDIDFEEVPVIRSLFQAKANVRCSALFLDLSDVFFIDSTAIATFLDYSRNAAKFGGNFCVIGLSGYLQGIFDTLQLQKAIPVFNGFDEANFALRGEGAPDGSAPGTQPTVTFPPKNSLVFPGIT